MGSRDERPGAPRRGGGAPGGRGGGQHPRGGARSAGSGRQPPLIPRTDNGPSQGTPTNGTDETELNIWADIHVCTRTNWEDF